MDNMYIYNAGREVPQEAQKPIKGGRLKGMTDINPVWRIKKLTELFGPCGIGWYYTKPEYQFVPGYDGTMACIVQTSLIYRESDGWSQPIPGIGGAMYIAKETQGLYTDDEAPKKALTDALSVACKALGIGADIYFAKDSSNKYTQPEPQPQEQASPKRSGNPQTQPQKQASPKRSNVSDDMNADMFGEPSPDSQATLADINYIRRHANPQQFSKCQMQYGMDLEKLRSGEAKILIQKLKNGTARGGT